MKRYFYVRNGEKRGPFSFEELCKEFISPDTLIWREGMTDWEPAGSLEELKVLFSKDFSVPPPVPAVDVKKEPVTTAPTAKHDRMVAQSLPKTWLTESILVTIFCCLPFGIPGIVYATKVESRFLAGDTMGAEEASRQAGRWTKLSFIFGIIYIVFATIYGIATGF